MPFAAVLDFLKLITENQYFDLVFTFIEWVFPYILIFLGSIWGGNQGFKTYQKSADYRWLQDNEFRAWKERDKVDLSEMARQDFKDYFNEMVCKLYNRDTETAKSAVMSYPEKHVVKLKKSSKLEHKWNTYFNSMNEITKLIEDETDPNKHSFVKKFTLAKAHWLIFMNSTFAKPYDDIEITNLMDMGIIPRDRQGGKNGPDGINQRHQSNF